MYGVLNSCNTKAKFGFERVIEEDKIVLLEEIVERTKAEIVLISSWRENWYKGKTEKGRQDEVANYLDNKLAQFNLEVFDKVYNGFNRAGCISMWLLTHREVDSFVIIDDDADNYMRYGFADRYVQSNNKTGLTKEMAERVISIFLK